jgi:organic radical activating enzyme
VLYPLAKQGVFRTIQGECSLSGVPMAFIRLGGCPLACVECDTDYAVAERVEATAITERVAEVFGGLYWVWITGGEPAVFDLLPLMQALRDRLPGCRIAVATAGIKPMPTGRALGWPDFLSVSPHSPAGWVQRGGSQLNLVAGLNGLRLADFSPLVEDVRHRFGSLWVTACEGKPETLDECVDWVNTHRDWRLNCQAHKVWGLA